MSTFPLVGSAAGRWHGHGRGPQRLAYPGRVRDVHARPGQQPGGHQPVGHHVQLEQQRLRRVQQLPRGRVMSLATEADAVPRLVGELRQALADLHEYVDRQARRIAEPWIEASQEAADERVRYAQEETRRQEELLAEMRRQLKPLNGHFERTRWATIRAGQKFYLNNDDGFPSIQCVRDDCNDLIIFVDPSSNLIELMAEAAEHKCAVKP